MSNFVNFMGRMPMSAFIFGLGSSVVNTVGSVFLPAQASTAIATATSAVSNVLSVASAPALAVTGLGLIAKGVHQILTTREPPRQRPPLHARRLADGRLVGYRPPMPPIPIGQRVRSTISRYLPAAANVYLGYQLANSQISSLAQTVQSGVSRLSNAVKFW